MGVGHKYESPDCDVQPTNDGFAAAVASTGARVMGQMKEALQDVVVMLRQAHAARQVLERQFSFERRLRLSLEHQLAELTMDEAQDMAESSASAFASQRISGSPRSP